MKKFNASRYEGLQTTPLFQQMATEEPDKVQACFNGVGSKVGWLNRLLYHIIPNTIWFLDITPCSDIHDFDCTYPKHFKNIEEATKCMDEACLRFRENMEAHIMRNTKNDFLLYLRLNRAMKYYVILKNACEKSFMEGKTFDEAPVKLNLSTVVK